MATDQRNLPAYFLVDADFQAFCQGIAAQIVVAGLVKTADTGQINNAAVTKPASTNTSQGYEIYRFNDALQATKPVYVKVEYGSGGAVDRPSLWFTVGSGSNGSGTLTGQVGTRRQIPASASKLATNTLPSYCCGSNGCFVLQANWDAANPSTYTFLAVIDRTRDGSGTATGDGVITLFCGVGGAGLLYQVIPSAGTVPAANTTPNSALGLTVNGPLGGGSRSQGANVALLPLMAVLGQLFYSLGVVCYNTADFTNATPIAVSNLGGSHTYMPLGLVGMFLSGSDGAAILWE